MSHPATLGPPPNPDICQDVENCDREHNEKWDVGGAEGGIGADCSDHHYECACDDCQMYIYLFLK